MKKWTDGDFKNYGKFIIEGTNAGDLDNELLSPIFTLGNDHLGQTFLHVNRPAPEVIAQPGSEVKLQFQFVYKNNHETRFGRDDIEIKMYQYSTIIERDNPYYTTWLQRC